MKPCTKDDPCELLVLEDDAILQELFNAQLRSEGDEGLIVTYAGTLGKAKSLITVRRFDIALIDLKLPDSEGLDTLRDMVAATEGKVPVVVFTGSISEAEKYEALRLGAQQVLFKGPMPVAAVLVVLRECAARHRNRLELISERDRFRNERNDWRARALRVETELQGLRESIRSRPTSGENLVQLDAVISEMHEIAASVAK